MSSRTSQDVLSCPKTSWDFCSGIVRKVRGSPGHVSYGQVKKLFFRKQNSTQAST